VVFTPRESMPPYWTRSDPFDSLTAGPDAPATV
jgi:hypothetical protein